MLAAVDKERNRIFVLAIPDVSAIKMDDVWHQSAPISMGEIDKRYKLITDLKVVASLVEEAKVELNIP